MLAHPWLISGPFMAIPGPSLTRACPVADLAGVRSASVRYAPSGRDPRRLKQHHAADACAGMHQIEALVDVGERQGVRDHGIDLDLLLHVPVDNFRHVGAAPRTAKGCPLPHTAGDELERAGGDFLAGTGNADDHAHTPAPVARLQRLTHDRDIAGAVEGVVGTANLVGTLFRHVDDVGDDVAADFLRIDKVRHAEALAPRLLCRIDVDANDHVSTGKSEPLDHIEADAPEAEHGAFGTGLNLG